MGEVNVAELVATAIREAKEKYDREARCPGCGAPTQLVHVTRGYGHERWHEERPAWCTPCLNAKIRGARLRPCRCDDAGHDHG